MADDDNTAQQTASDPRATMTAVPLAGGAVMLQPTIAPPRDPRPNPLGGEPMVRSHPLQSMGGEGDAPLYSRPFGSQPGTFDPKTGLRFRSPPAQRTDVDGSDVYADTDAGASAALRHGTLGPAGGFAGFAPAPAAPDNDPSRMEFQPGG